LGTTIINALNVLANLLRRLLVFFILNLVFKLKSLNWTCKTPCHYLYPKEGSCKGFYCLPSTCVYCSMYIWENAYQHPWTRWFSWRFWCKLEAAVPLGGL